MEGRAGQQFGNYRLLRLIGHGGFADVYLGEHIYIGTQAAIKVLHTQLGNNDLELFQAEARVIARLEHPHIVRILEFGVEDTIPFLVLSYAPYGTLRDRHPKGTVLPLPTIVNYVQQVANALQYAHKENVIHRDIKPENMLVGRRQEILLSDFGIALVSQSSRYQSVKDLAGTAAYMAPEQIEARPRPASDQYALGIVVYEWLSGSCPFQGTFTETALKHATVPPPSLREKLPNLPPEVEEVVMTALAKDPTRRFASVKAFAYALEQAIRPARPSVTVEVENAPTVPVIDNSKAPVPQVGAAQAQTPLVLPVVHSEESVANTEGSGEPYIVLPTVITPSPHLTPPSLPISQPSAPQPSLTPNIAGQSGVPVRDRAPNPVTPLPGNAMEADDYPPPLRRSWKWPVALIALVLLIIGGSIFGAFALLRKPKQTSRPPKVLQTAIVNLQASHRQSVDAYNQAVTAHGIMFGYGPLHTHINPYETILNAGNIAGSVQAWVVSTGNSFYYSSPIMAGGSVYIGAHNGELYAFSALSGQQKWVAATGGAIDSSPAEVNGVVYVGSEDDDLYAFDAATGHLKWKTPTQGPIFSAPTVVDGVVYIGSHDHKLYAFDAATGHQEWATSTGFFITYSSPAVANGIVYVGSNDHKLYAFDAVTGHQKWSAPTGGPILSSPAVANGIVYVGSNDHKLYAFDAVTGHQKWSAPTGGPILSSPAVIDGTVYIGSNDHKLYAFDAVTGHQKWTALTGDFIESSPVWANGLVYVGSWDHKLYAFDATDGLQEWAVSLSGRIYSSPMIANGMIYSSDEDGRVYAFQAAS